MVEVSAKYFVEIHKSSDITKLIETSQWYNSEHLFLGGGSNILFTQNYPGIIIHNNIKGKDILHEDDTAIHVRVGAGENWHEFVKWSVENGYWGIENLVLIPGTVGAAPVQNIGAYGVEVADSIVSATAVDVLTGEKKTYTHTECEFKYRDSFFKENQGEYCITSVIFRLSKVPQPIIHYGPIQEIINNEGLETPSLQKIAGIITDIRKSKLPDVGSIGMAGSFFKNPIISQQELENIQNKFPDVKFFPLEDGSVKIPAGWIIETLGFKGVTEGKVGTYEKHALVIVNHGNATGKEVWDFARKIMNKVNEVFNIELEPEVNVI